MRKKRVLLLSEGFGTGHTQAAHALSVSLRQMNPDVQTRVLELGTFLNPKISPWILGAYRKTISSKPKLYAKLYRFQYKKTLNRFTQLALHRIFYRQTEEVIKQLKPDAIVCTHPFPNIVVSRLKKAGLSVPLCTVITDYDAHGTWISPEVNKYLVSTQDVKNKLLSLGVPAKTIAITGIPVHPGFWEKHNKNDIRSQFGLSEIPTVLIMGGGWGMMNQETIFDYMLKWRSQIQFIICMGSNEKGLQKLSEDPRFKHPNVHLLGFTREVDKLMEVSDLLITKPGGVTCTEGMAKGIPMLFYEAFPGQEEDNLQYFVEHGFGEPIASEETIDRWFHKLLDNNAQNLDHKSALDMNDAYPPATYTKAIMELLH